MQDNRDVDDVRTVELPLHEVTDLHNSIELLGALAVVAQSAVSHLKSAEARRGSWQHCRILTVDIETNRQARNVAIMTLRKESQTDIRCLDRRLH